MATSCREAEHAVRVHRVLCRCCHIENPRLQVGLLSAGISQTHGKQQRDLLHLTFFAMTAFEGGLQELSTQEKIRESLPFLSSPVRTHPCIKLVCSYSLKVWRVFFVPTQCRWYPFPRCRSPPCTCHCPPLCNHLFVLALPEALCAQADRQILLDFALKLMLHPPVRQQEPTNPLQAGRLPPSLARTGLGPLTAQAPGLAGASVGALATPVPMTPALQGARGGQLGARAAAGGTPPPGGLGAAGQGDAAMNDAGEDDDDVFDAIASLGAESHGVGPVAPGLSSTDMETLTKVCCSFQCNIQLHPCYLCLASRYCMGILYARSVPVLEALTLC